MQVTIIGGGMITHDQILPSFYQLQRLGLVEAIAVCARTENTLRALAASETLKQAFPGQSFRAVTAPYREAIAQMPPRNLVVVALPDHLHFDAVMGALEADQHLLVVKPLVLKASKAETIEREALRRGLFVGVEYHKRFDDRSLMARGKYRAGDFGEFRLGAACLMEKWFYRHSNFQNWCTTENSDAFTYIGCHYVDLVHFITGLTPVSVSVYGIKDQYPNGREGFLWTDARVIWSNGACLNVQNSLGFPDEAPGTNTQGLTLYCACRENGALLRHSDQYRGLEYVYTQRPDSAGGTIYAEPSPDYFQYVDLGGRGLTPVGYGYRSIEYLLRCCLRVESATDRQATIREIDDEGIAATPANSRYNEQVIEAARRSILNGGAMIPVAS
ncbi:MAG TPA: Gfo/Idh/MocA family oxidoreductase [Bryobacteraceae bacterium]|nr:Gfo/Idh/MocA family oxidoreductase [Bryobacteraceae bacterium]